MVKYMMMIQQRNAQSGCSEGDDSAPLWLASRSPRRRWLLDEAGYGYQTVESGIDEAGLRPGGVPVEHWTSALAYLKATGGVRAVHMQGASSGLVLAADTVVVFDGEMIGQPQDAAHARRILHLLRDAPHDVVTGVALIDVRTGIRTFFHDIATVHVGSIDDDEIEAYLVSENWRGKAGAYNLAEQIDAGWPITYEGDPGTIMGLPMERLSKHLESHWGVAPDRAA